MRRSLFLVALIVLTASTRSCAAFNYESCPQWLKDYEDFHSRNRNSETAKFLIGTFQVVPLERTVQLVQQHRQPSLQQQLLSVLHHQKPDWHHLPTAGRYAVHYRLSLCKRRGIFSASKARQSPHSPLQGMTHAMLCGT